MHLIGRDAAIFCQRSWWYATPIPAPQCTSNGPSKSYSRWVWLYNSELILLSPPSLRIPTTPTFIITPISYGSGHGTPRHAPQTVPTTPHPLPTRPPISRSNALQTTRDALRSPTRWPGVHDKEGERLGNKSSTDSATFLQSRNRRLLLSSMAAIKMCSFILLTPLPIL